MAIDNIGDYLFSKSFKNLVLNKFQDRMYDCTCVGGGTSDDRRTFFEKVNQINLGNFV